MNSAASSVVARLVVVPIILFLTILGLCAILQNHDAVRFAHACPRAVIDAIYSCASSADCWGRVYCTLWLSLKGFSAGLVLAVAAGAVFASRPTYVRFAAACVGGLRALPLTLLVPFLVALPTALVFPPGMYGDGPKSDPTYLVALGTFLQMSVGISEGIEHRSHEREMYLRRVLGWSRLRYTALCLFWEVMPSALTACRIALVFALVLAIVLEQLVFYPGVGRLIADSMADDSATTGLEAQAMALLLMVALLGLFLDMAMAAVTRLLTRWR